MMNLKFEKPSRRESGVPQKRFFSETSAKSVKRPTEKTSGTSSRTNSAFSGNLLGMAMAGGAAMLLTLTACSDENPWGNQSNETGSITLSLTTDSDIKTSKPIFRSEEEGTRAEGTLADYIDMPAADDFSIKLEKDDGSYSKTWDTLQDFKNETTANEFTTGSYTLTAFYGKNGEQDFESPYFEASDHFTLLAGQTQKVSLTAELKNSMVKINYTDGFKAYMSDYHTKLSTEGRSDEIVFSATEQRPAFINPNSAELTVHFTTRGKGYKNNIPLGKFAPLAKTLHNVTIDVVESQNGNATLGVTFDDTLEDENIFIDLTEELLTTPAPVITCDGFENGSTLDMLEGTPSDFNLKMNVLAKATIAKATLLIESSEQSPLSGKEIDLCSATEDLQNQLATAGIKATGFGFKGATDKFAILDLTEFGKSLGKGEHKISLKVEDKNGAVSETASVTLNSFPVTLEMVGTPSIIYGSGEAVLTMDYNGKDPLQNVTFTALGADGEHHDVRTKSCQENTSTRAFESKRYTFTIELPETTKTQIEIKAFYKKGTTVYEGTVPVTIPAYTIEIDPFSYYATLRVTTADNDPSTLAAVVKYLTFKDSQLTIADSDRNPNGLISIKGLQPSTGYTVESSITGGEIWNANGTFTTEAALPIPNGEFDGVENLQINGLQVGGEYRVGINYHHTSSIDRKVPAEWATINSLTAYPESMNKNTWFIVPSTYVDNNAAILRTVGYNHNGNTPERSGGATRYYCANAPSADQLNVAAGELFLGTYSFNGEEHRNEGIGFASRPNSVSFDYTYAPNGNDTGYAIIEILDESGNKLGSKIFSLTNGNGTETLDFNYAFGKKAARLKVGFKSSTQGENAPITIPSGSALNEGQGLGNHTIAANSYKAVATGSVLTIDNVTAHYDGAPAANKAPKGKKIAKADKATKRVFGTAKNVTRNNNKRR